MLAPPVPARRLLHTASPPAPLASPRRGRPVSVVERPRASAAQSSAGSAGSARDDARRDVGAAVDVLRRAAQDRSPPAAAVCAALRSVEEAKALDAEQLGAALDGARWRLVFTSSAGDLEKLRKTGAGGGKYFPVTAVQSWSASGAIRNGVYLGHWAALQFDGPFRLNGKRLQFDFTQLSLRFLGLQGKFQLKPPTYELPANSTKAGGALPFFLFALADGQLVVARGRSGGVALWARAQPSWLLESGALPLE